MSRGENLRSCCHTLGARQSAEEVFIESYWNVSQLPEASGGSNHYAAHFLTVINAEKRTPVPEACMEEEAFESWWEQEYKQCGSKLDGMRGDELAGLDFSGGGFGQYRFSMNSKRLYDGVELAATGESCPLPGGLTYTSQDIAMGKVVLDQNWSYLECEFISHDGGKYNVLQLFEKALSI